MDRLCAHVHKTKGGFRSKMGRAASSFELRCLGSLRVFVDGLDVTPRRGKVGLALAELVASRHTPVTAVELLERVWDEAASPSGLHKVHQFMNRIRTRYPGAVRTVGGAYELDDNNVAIDVWEFEDAVANEAPIRILELLDDWTEPVFHGLDPISSRTREYVAATEAQRSRIAEETFGQLSAADLDQSFSSCEREFARDPDSPTLAIAVAAVLQRRGRPADALDVLVGVRTRLGERGLSSPDSIVEAELAVLQEKPIQPASKKTAGRRFKRERAGFSLPRPLANHFVGRDDELRIFDESFAVSRGACRLIEGPPGVGKTELLLQVGNRFAGSGCEVRYGAASNLTSTPFAALMSAVPECLEIDFEVDGSDVATIVAWRRMRDVLEQLGRTSPVLLLFDDLHDADSATLGFLRYLADCGLPNGLSIMATARPVDPLRSGAWLETREALLRSADGPSPAIGPLGSAEVAELLRHRFPESASADLLRIAMRVIHVTQGLALDVATLLHGWDSLPVPTDVMQVGAADRFVARANNHQGLRLLGLAATIGVHFDVVTLSRLSGDSLRDISDHLQDAVFREIIVELDDGTFRFVHAVAAHSFAQTLPLVARQMAHSHLAKEPDLSESERCRHVRDSGALLGNTEAYKLLMTSAAKLEADRLFFEAVETVREAERRAIGALQLADARILSAGIFARIGTEETARLARDNALAVIPDGDLGRLKALAMSGLPDGESAYPEPDRLALFDQVAKLEPDDRDWDPLFNRMHVRMTWMCDDLPGARALLADLYREREGHDDPELKYEELLVDSMSPRRRKTREEHAQLFDQLSDGRLRAGAAYRRAWDELQQCGNEFEELIALAITAARDAGAGRTEWLAELLRATSAGASVSIADHRDNTAPQLAFLHLVDNAHRVGMQLGIREIDSARLAQTIQQYWFANRLHELADVVSAHPRVADGRLATAGAALTLSSSPGREAEADGLLRYLMDGLKECPDSTTAPDICCLAIEAAYTAQSSVDIGLALEVLDDRASEALIGALGSLYLGPVDRYRAMAFRIRGECESAVVGPLLRGAAEQMNNSGHIYWEQRCQRLMNK